jgi:hypothetical protein
MRGLSLGWITVYLPGEWPATKLGVSAARNRGANSVA